MKFQKSLLKGLWDTWKVSFMTLCKLGFIMDQYDYKLEFPNIIWLKSSKLDFQQSLCNDRRDTLKNPFMALYKLSCIIGSV